MSSVVDYAIQRLRSLPPNEQDGLARMLLQLSGEEQPVHWLTQEEELDLDEADAEIARGDFATEDEVRAVWAKHGL